MKLLRRRKLAVLAGVLLLAQLVVLGTGAPAQAATCSYIHYDGSWGVESRVVFDWDSECTDGVADLKGTVSDPLCDARAAYVTFTIYDLVGTGYREIASKRFVAGNGCGTSATFHWRPPSPGSFGWQIGAKMQACSTTCSSARYQWGSG